ncbi:hypothetical protein OHA44_07070 [Streptomyces sp. NBC_00144]|uniref:hypothetical protein n=1 Tax=Streptomyces sp. NBC_00144 TaxID=2975665 RepID=UPI00324F29D5
MEVAALRHYIAYRRMANLTPVVFRAKHEVILAYLRVDPDTIELEEYFSRDMRGIGYLGTGESQSATTPTWASPPPTPSNSPLAHAC